MLVTRTYEMYHVEQCCWDFNLLGVTPVYDY